MGRPETRLQTGLAPLWMKRDCCGQVRSRDTHWPHLHPSQTATPPRSTKWRDAVSGGECACGSDDLRERFWAKPVHLSCLGEDQACWPINDRQPMQCAPARPSDLFVTEQSGSLPRKLSLATSVRVMMNMHPAHPGHEIRAVVARCSVMMSARPLGTSTRQLHRAWVHRSVACRMRRLSALVSAGQRVAPHARHDLAPLCFNLWQQRADIDFHDVTVERRGSSGR